MANEHYERRKDKRFPRKAIYRVAIQSEQSSVLGRSIRENYRPHKISYVQSFRKS